MTHASEWALRYAVATDVGRRGGPNEDSAYASPRILAIADGMGGHAHGEVASATVVAAVADLDAWLVGPDAEGADEFASIAGAVMEAGNRLAELVGSDEELRGMGTTCTALLWRGIGFAVAHVGDSRAYLLRDGELWQLTTDHTLVQALVDEGTMSPEEAATHPGRSMLMRALQAGGNGEPDVFEQDARPGDRFLLCSDGLTDYVPLASVFAALTEGGPREAADALVALADRAGGHDNATCVVADVVEGDGGTASTEPVVVGAAAKRTDAGRPSRPGWLPAWAAKLFAP